jgi:hypothetical protein
MKDANMSSNIRVYGNKDVLRVIGLIPPNHVHMRLIIVFKDQVIVLQEASAAAIARAYVEITTHPTRRAVEYTQLVLRREEKKPGYAEVQLIETNRSEEEIIKEWCEIAVPGVETKQQHVSHD